MCAGSTTDGGIIPTCCTDTEACAHILGWPLSGSHVQHCRAVAGAAAATCQEQDKSEKLARLVVGVAAASAEQK